MTFGGCDVQIERRVPSLRAASFRGKATSSRSAEMIERDGGGQAVMHDASTGRELTGLLHPQDGAAVPEPVPDFGRD